jgi:hypothetical protein
MIALLTLALAQAPTIVTGAPPLRRAVPATEWSCAFEGEDGRRFRLSGRIDEIPAGWDPNRSRPVEIAGDGPPALIGKGGATNNEADEHFRDYQVQTMQGNETYFVNLKLRRGGSGVAYITRYVSSADHRPLFYIAAGLCTSNFDVASKGAGK